MSKPTLPQGQHKTASKERRRTAVFTQATLWDEKTLLAEGLHPQQHRIERESLQHMRSITQ